jgi:hypothetical protein
MHDEIVLFGDEENDAFEQSLQGKCLDNYSPCMVFYEMTSIAEI